MIDRKERSIEGIDNEKKKEGEDETFRASRARKKKDGCKPRSVFFFFFFFFPALNVVFGVVFGVV